MTQQDFSISFDLWKQMELSTNVEIIPSVNDWMLKTSEAKFNKREMRRIRKVLLTHDKVYKQETINKNSF